MTVYFKWVFSCGVSRILRVVEERVWCVCLWLLELRVVTHIKWI